jgi:hypothetical protein
MTDSMTVAVAVAIAIGIVIVLGLAVLAALVRPRPRTTDRMGRYPAAGMSLGMLLGAVLGVVVWQSTGEFVFWVIFVGGGMVTGLAIGSSWAARHG